MVTPHHRSEGEATPEVEKATTKTRSVSLKKKLFFSIVPVCVLLAAAEVAARVLGLADAHLVTSPLPEEDAGLFQTDPDLFWSLTPNFDIEYERAEVRTNSVGLRAPEIGPKAANEYRVLSLGESTTFGVGVDNDQTYTERFGSQLQKRLPAKRVVAINAGVSAYSSFQSLKYLELRGLELQPDLVLFYHEVNDYLPSTLRNSGNTEIGVLKTDKQLYESRVQGLHRTLLDVSALYKWLNNLVAYERIKEFNRDEFDNPMLDVGLPDLSIPPRLTATAAVAPQTGLNEVSLGRRVSDEERREVFEQLVALCGQRGVQLVVIHPAYRASKPHECLLTRFCEENDVPMFDAFESLHPPDGKPLFIDSFHPNRRGHRRLARRLVEFVMTNIMN